MVSVQAGGKLRFYRRKANGSQELIYGNDMAALGPSGSVDGVIQSTPEKWLNLKPFVSAQKRLEVNDQLILTFEASVGVTVDASDSQFSIPIIYQDGTPDTIGSPDNSAEWDVLQTGDTAFLAGVETALCIKTVRKPFALGGGPIFASVEDNA